MGPKSKEQGLLPLLPKKLTALGREDRFGKQSQLFELRPLKRVP
jgi:hypothetical protein